MKKRKLAKVTINDLLRTRPAQCESCSRKDMLTVDHIVPIFCLKDMGLTMEEQFSDLENMRLLCRPCNSLKASRLDFSDRRTKELLIKYLERL